VLQRRPQTGFGHGGDRLLMAGLRLVTLGLVDPK